MRTRSDYTRFRGMYEWIDRPTHPKTHQPLLPYTHRNPISGKIQHLTKLWVDIQKSKATSIEMRSGSHQNQLRILGEPVLLFA